MDKYKRILELLEEGQKLGIDFKNITQKIIDFINTSSTGKMKIVLLGSFSDGKTTLIGGLLGKMLENMKIDQAESSDQLEIYSTEFLDQSFEIIDTPGLFGTKEKVVDGKNIKFSDITKNYISEANMMIYVCDAVTPLKDSHVDVMRRILIDYKKLDSTIFVINKMDEAGTLLLDDEDYKRMSDIKKKNIIKRLEDCFKLSPTQINNLKIVCVAADPKGKGLEHWLARKQDYYNRSHLSLLKEQIESLTENADKDKIYDDTRSAVINDVLAKAYSEFSLAITEPNKALKECKRELEGIQENLKLFDYDIKQNKKNMSQCINAIQDRVMMSISNCGMETIGDVMQQLGVKDEKLTFYRLTNEISQVLSETSEENNHAFDSMNEIINISFMRMDDLIRNLFNGGAMRLKGVNLTNVDILKARDSIAKLTGFKHLFKPRGAGNLAVKLGNFARWGGVIISGGLVVWDLWSTWKNKKKFDKAKKDLLEAVDKLFCDEVIPLYQTDNAYYENFAPSYISMKQLVEQKERDVAAAQIVIDNYKTYQRKLKKIFDEENIEYTEYEEL